MICFRVTMPCIRELHVLECRCRVSKCRYRIFECRCLISTSLVLRHHAVAVFRSFDAVFRHADTLVWISDAEFWTRECEKWMETIPLSDELEPKFSPRNRRVSSNLAPHRYQVVSFSTASTQSLHGGGNFLPVCALRT